MPAQIPPASGQSTPAPTAQVTAATLPDPKTLSRGQWEMHAIHQEKNGPVMVLRGHAEMEDNTLLLRAEEIVYNEDTKVVRATGSVYYHGFAKNEQIWCESLEYDTENERGKFWDVRGEAMPRVVVRRGILSGNSPFHFEGEWAERLGAKYILYNGWITNCKMPKPWWRMNGPKFDIIPGDKATGHDGTFYIRNIPLFYTPYFYHSLEKQPRHSGFLNPNLVPRSERGFMIGLGYFWAINRSYDLTYLFQDYNSNAFGHNVNFRGKPRAGTDFNFIFYGVQDEGGVPGSNPPTRYSGYSVNGVFHSDLGNGWNVNGFVNYITSFNFRQYWSGSYTEAVGSEIHAVGFLDKKWDGYIFDFALSRLENFQNSETNNPVLQPNGSTKQERDAILIHKLPEASFSSSDRSIFQNVPIWFSFYSAAGLLYRTEPIESPIGATGDYSLVENYSTRQFTPRLDFAPHITTAAHFWHMDFVPSIGVAETYYGGSQVVSPLSPVNGMVLYQAVNNSLVRSERDFSMDVLLPSLERVFNRKTIFGDKLKHVIEPRLTYKYVTGVGDQFYRILRFDQTDILANTNEVEASLINRLYAKRGNDTLEILSWELAAKRYFDPTFGGALVSGQANIIANTEDLTGYAFLVGPRDYSPIVSKLRATLIPSLSVNWQLDYDTYYHRIVDQYVQVDYRWWKNYFASVGDGNVNVNPLLLQPPLVNQPNFRAGYGNQQHRGWNGAYAEVYDIHAKRTLTSSLQVTYNTDCCGFSVEYRRFNFGIRDETQWMFAFSIANIGTFGTLRTQDRLF
ncbi:MAG: LPS assembly protein LptD [Bryobacteraceae bacterium]|jgi:LPS-assembly protein